MPDSKPPKIILFSAPGCTYCRMAKQYFQQKRLKFKEIDVSRDASAARDAVRYSGSTGVPVILINGRVVRGFDRKKIDQLLSQR